MHARDASDPAYAASEGRVALVAGASGLVGRALLARLCADPGVSRVHALVRRPVDLQVQAPGRAPRDLEVGATAVANAFARERAPTGDPAGGPTGDPAAAPTGDPTGDPAGDPTRASATTGVIRARDGDVPAGARPGPQLHVADFTNLPPLPRCDEVYLALGTTIAVAGSREAFRAVDFEANRAVAHAALAAGARRIGLVSAMGADAGSRVFYSRTKGELEDALAALPLEALVIARPSLLLGDRARLGQPRRRGEHLAAVADRWLRPLLPARLRGIAAEDVAAALAAAVPAARGRQILDSARMQGAATA